MTTCIQPLIPTVARLVLAISGAALAACSGGAESADADPDADRAGGERVPGVETAPGHDAAPSPAPHSAPLVHLLSEGQVAFGIFSGPTTREQGAEMGRNRGLDFVFYSLESGPFDLETMAEYMAGVADGSGVDPAHPLVLRVPPIRDDEAQARENVARALDAGVAGVVFPHVESAEDAVAAVSAMGASSWPGNADGTLVNMLIVEDRAGVERVDEIVGTPGASVVFAGPGDLRRAYEGDMTAVEDAIQTILNACKTHVVPCGITAGADDIGDRIAQGFRVFIVSDTAAVTAGRLAEEGR